MTEAWNDMKVGYVAFDYLHILLSSFFFLFWDGKEGGQAESIQWDLVVNMEIYGSRVFSVLSFALQAGLSSQASFSFLS